MRKLSDRTRVQVNVFDIVDSGIVRSETESKEELIVECPLAFELTSPDDLNRIEHLVAECLISDVSENDLLRRLQGLDPDSEMGPYNPEVDREIIISKFQSEEATPLTSLYAGILSLSAAWQEPGVSSEHIGAVIAFNLTDDSIHPDEKDLPPSEIWVHPDVPVWVIEYGSLRSIFTTLLDPLNIVKWGIVAYGLVRSPFTKAYEASESFVGELRDRAAKRIPKPIDLLRLDEFDLFGTRPKEKYDTVLIFLHGLFSTDLGTFDGFQNVWNQMRSDYRKIYGSCADQVFERISILGWPHDTLVPINENADDLAKLICKNFGELDYKLVFVCHSRGGLLARATLQKLLFQDLDKWKTRIRGIATFGTPHHGAKLAKTPGRYSGAYLILLNGTRTFIALDKLFVYMHHRRRIDGIDDLAPLDNRVSKFLKRLEDDERAHQPFNFIAVGGDVTIMSSTKSPIQSWIKKKLFSSVSFPVGSSNHDGVVETKSSCPHWAETLDPTGCTHFEYFASDQKVAMHTVSKKLASWLEIENDIEKCRKNQDLNEVIHEENGVSVGGHYIPTD